MNRLFCGAALLSLFAGCLPASNPFDPDNPAATGGTIKGLVKAFYLVDACAEPDISNLGVTVLLNNQVFSPNADGTFSADVPAGTYNITVTAPGFTSDGFGVIELAPGQTVDLLADVDTKKPVDLDCGCHDPDADPQPFQPVDPNFDVGDCACPDAAVCTTRADGGSGKIFQIVENQAPWPPYLTASATVTNQPSVILTPVSLGGDPSGNFSNTGGYQFQINGSNTDQWNRLDISEGAVGVSLIPNTLNHIAYRSSDSQHNKSLVNFLIVEHDDIPPAPPTLTLDPGDGFIDLTWAAGDRPLDDDPDGTARDVERYAVHYGVSPQNLTGAFADQGPSPLITTERAVRLSGLANGQRVYVMVEAWDNAGNVSSSLDDGAPTHSAVPDLVTPVLLTETDVVAPMVTTVFDDRLAYALDASGTVTFIDLATGLATGASLSLPGAQDIALYGHLLVAARGPAGISTVDVTNPATPGPVNNLSFTDEGLFPGGFTGEAVGIATQLGQAFVTVRDPAGGVWRVDISNGTSPQTLAFHELNAITQLSAANFHGSVRVNGRYLATQYFGPAEEGGSLNQGLPNTGDHILIMTIDNQDAGGFSDPAIPCRLFSPSVDVEFVEVFTGDNIVTPASAADAVRKQFAYYGDYLFAPYDGSVVVYDVNAGGNLGGTCADQSLVSTRRTATATLGVVPLGLRTAFAVDVAGEYLTVASGSRFTSGVSLGDRLDVISLADLADSPGAQGGVTTQLDVVGRLDDTPARAGVRMVGPNAWLFSDRVGQYELFTPRVLARVAEVGENPTGASIGLGPYVVHQRALRGVGIWDVTRAHQPSIVNGTNCVPSCFEEQDLAGQLTLDEGVLIAGLTAGGANNEAVMFVDVASDPTDPANLGTATNPCSSGEMRGVTVHHRYLFVGCADVPEVYLFDRAWDQLRFPTPGDVPTAFSLLDNAELTDTVADLAVARTLSDSGTWEFSLLVLYTGGGLDAFRIPPQIILSISPSSFGLRTADGSAATNTGFGTAQRLHIDGDRLFITGTRSCQAGECDAGATVNAVHVVDLTTGQLAADQDWVLGHDEPEVRLTVHRDVIIVGHSGGGNVIEAYRAPYAEPVAITDPNAFGLANLVHGGHVFSADMNVFRLE